MVGYCAILAVSGVSKILGSRASPPRPEPVAPCRGPGVVSAVSGLACVCHESRAKSFGAGDLTASAICHHSFFAIA